MLSSSGGRGIDPLLPIGSALLRRPLSTVRRFFDVGPGAMAAVVRKVAKRPLARKPPEVGVASFGLRKRREWIVAHGPSQPGTGAGSFFPRKEFRVEQFPTD